MNGQAQSVIAVDIGNSGLRLANLKLPPESSLSVDRVTKVERINWKHPPTKSPTPAQAAEASHAYDSSDPNWLTELERILQEVVSSAEVNSGPQVLEWPDANGTNRTVGTDRELPGLRRVHWFISSVRRDALALLLSFLSSRPHFVAHVITYRDIGFEVAVQFPERVGIDRLLAARAAMAFIADRPLIVVQAGSAITVDWVTADGAFGGGAIVPGVPMMLRLLGQTADLLPDVEASELIDLPPLPGVNTEQAMRCGVSSAVVGGAQHLIQRYREQASAAVPVILSGGDGPRLAKHLTPPIREIDQLVLRGIAQVAAQRLRAPQPDLPT